MGVAGFDVVRGNEDGQGQAMLPKKIGHLKKIGIAVIGSEKDGPRIPFGMLAHVVEGCERQDVEVSPQRLRDDVKLFAFVLRNFDACVGDAFDSAMKRQHHRTPEGSQKKWWN